MLKDRDIGEWFGTYFGLHWGSGFSCNKINIGSVYGTDRANGWIELGR